MPLISSCSRGTSLVQDAGDSCISAIPCPKLPETCEGTYQGFDQYHKLQGLSVPKFYGQVFEHINIS